MVSQDTWTTAQYNGTIGKLRTVQAIRPNTYIGDTRGRIVILLLRAYEGRRHHSGKNLREGVAPRIRTEIAMQSLPSTASSRANLSMEIAVKCCSWQFSSVVWAAPFIANAPKIS